MRSTHELHLHISSININDNSVQIAVCFCTNKNLRYFPQFPDCQSLCKLLQLSCLSACANSNNSVRNLIQCTKFTIKWPKKKLSLSLLLMSTCILEILVSKY